ncbi:hypothetical protein J2045_002136 [Peteryoungia aggregata LMG 23059]|uniref:Uncharacterized protein n=1 Tax=Peteryoungia aggregata LMG 23059 TaxID=1368425 RepID=A0ABU0G6Z6_9HYPH|nr:hypothetical protein [Peteryoungia aggregata]MDQ0421109.1 hypothetical protein [Peteryoungia aggregata LMG 23059]
MSVSTLLNAAVNVSLRENAEVHKRWINVMHRLAGQYGTGLLTMAGDTRLDMLLRSIEAETAKRISANQEQIDLVFDLQLKLSESWILSIYEVLRTACQQARSKGLEHIALKTLHDEFKLVRIPLAKLEIANAKLAEPELMLQKFGGEEEEPESYIADASYIIHRAVCTSTGAIQWMAIDIKKKANVWINRHNLSDKLLAFAD